MVLDPRSERPIVALDAGSYDPDLLAPYAGTHPWVAPWWRSFRSAVEAAGFDVVMARDLPPAIDRQVLLVTQGWTPLSEALVGRTKVIPAILLSLESPMTDWAFYHALPTLGRPYRRVFVFRGAMRRVKPNDRARPFHAPQVPPDPALVIPQVPWAERRFLVSINANKFVPAVSPLNLVRALAARVLSRQPQELKPSVRRQLTCLFDPALASGYEERWRAILHFSRNEDFDLYGRGWANPDAYSAPAHVLRRALPRYAGQIEDFRGKLLVLSRYRFALATENTSFPGYISEKIFDCFFAGTVPVYYGAPDVGRAIPPDAFIDMRLFQRLDELERFLRKMSAGEWQRLLAAGKEFLASPAFQAFHHATVSKQLADALREILAAERDAG